MEYTNNIYTYLKWRGDLTIKENPLNDVDALILSELSYIEFDEIVPKVGEEGNITIWEANQKYISIESKNPYYTMKEELFDAIAKTKRFANMTLCNYVSRTDVQQCQQFAAVHVNVLPGLTFVAFRGTDTSIVGWKEDCNMTYMMPVPAQQSAVEYINKTTKGWMNKYWLGGHSKGGNLAIYSGVFCEPKLQKKIMRIISFDGPGFNRKMINETAYIVMKDKIKAYVPKESFVGLLMEHEEEFTVVQSHKESFLQHEGLFWKINGPEFELAEELDEQSKGRSDTIKSWLDKIDSNERKELIDAIFNLFENAGIEDFTDFVGMDAKAAGALLKALTSVPKEEKELVGKLVKLLVEESVKK